MAATSTNLLLHLPHTHSFPPPRQLPFIRHFPAISSGGGGSIEPAGPIEPAVGEAKVLWFKSGYNAQILAEESETEEALLRRFRREVANAGVIQECKRRRFFENKKEERKRKHKEACRRNRKRSFPSFPS